jgi:hypothetical protein
VRRAAIERGNIHRVVTSASENAVDALLEHCRKVATFPEPEMRCLTAADLQSVFDKATSMSVRMTSDLANAIEGALTKLTPTATPLSFALTTISGELPPLPQHSMPRVKLCESVGLSLAGRPVLIVGTEGKGKSIVANLVARSAEALGSRPFWEELPDDSGQACLSLERVLAIARARSGINLLVLDDLPAAQGVSRDVWRRLHLLLETCKAEGIQLLMTAKGVPEDQVDSRFRSEGVVVMAVPSLTEAEVADLLLALGCPQQLIEGWTKSILFQSGFGHPKLVHLRALELLAEGWPPVTGESFLSAPASIEEARTNARQTVAKTVAEPEKSYLYALSISALPFSRALAIRVGNAMGIAAPGDSFDRLLGRWIEAKGGGRHSVTNLLQNQASLALGQAMIEAAHGHLFDAAVGEGSINPGDAWGLFFQAFQSRSVSRMGAITTSLLTTSFKRAKGLGESLQILLSIAAGNSLLGNFDAKTTALFRHLQYKIAVDVKPDALADIARQWKWAIDQVEEDEVRRSLSVVRGLALAITLGGDIPPDVLVPAIVDASPVQEMDISNARPQFKEMRRWDDTELSMPGMLFMIYQGRATGARFLDETLTALSALEPDVRSGLLEAFDAPFSENVSAIAKVWLIESAKAQPDWPSALAAINRAFDLAVEWQAASMGRNAARILSIVYDEIDAVKDQVKSNAILDEAERHFGNSPVLDDQRANLAYRHGDNPNALRLGLASLDLDGHGGGKVADPYAARRAGLAAANTSDFHQAASIFERASLMVHQEASGPPPAAFQLDAALCWFKQGNGSRMVEALAKAVNAVNGAFDPKASFDLFRVQKFFGHIAMWLVDQMGLGVGSGAASGLDVPQIGNATNPEKVAAIADLPPVTYDVLCALVVRISERLEVDFVGSASIKEVVERTSVAMAEFLSGDTHLRGALAAPDYSAFEDGVLRWCRGFWRVGFMHATGGDANQPNTTPTVASVMANDLRVHWLFALALAIVAMRGGNVMEHADGWARRLAIHSDASKLLSELALARSAFEIDPASASQQMRATASLESFAAAAIFLGQPTRAPFDTAFAQVGFIAWLYGSMPMLRIQDAALPTLASLFATQWKQHLSFPAAFREPAMSVRALRSAIDFQGSAPERLLKILIAASNATGMQIGPAANEISKANRIGAEAERLRR